MQQVNYNIKFIDVIGLRADHCAANLNWNDQKRTKEPASIKVLLKGTHEKILETQTCNHVTQNVEKPQTIDFILII